jgi:hypothetical protein
LQRPPGYCCLACLSSSSDAAAIHSSRLDCSPTMRSQWLSSSRSCSWRPSGLSSTSCPSISRMCWGSTHSSADRPIDRAVAVAGIQLNRVGPSHREEIVETRLRLSRICPHNEPHHDVVGHPIVVFQDEIEPEGRSGRYVDRILDVDSRNHR